jgi:hypothetical protein
MTAEAVSTGTAAGEKGQVTAMGSSATPRALVLGFVCALMVACAAPEPAGWRKPTRLRHGPCR